MGKALEMGQGQAQCISTLAGLYVSLGDPVLPNGNGMNLPIKAVLSRSLTATLDTLGSKLSSTID